MPARKGLLAPQNTFLDTIANRFDGTHGFCDLTGYSRAQIMQKSCACDFLYGAKTDAQHRQAIKEALKTHQEFKLKLVLYKSSGTPFWCLLDIVPILDEKHEIVLFLCSHKDITKEKLIEEQQLQLAQLHARKAAAVADRNQLACELALGKSAGVSPVSETVAAPESLVKTTTTTGSGEDEKEEKEEVKLEEADEAELAALANQNALLSMDEFDLNNACNENGEFNLNLDDSDQDNDKTTTNQYSRRRSRAVLYQLSGHYGYGRRSVNMKSKLKLNNRMNIPEYKTTTIEKQRFILSHYGVGKSCWDWLILIVSFYVAIVVPYNATFKPIKEVRSATSGDGLDQLDGSSQQRDSAGECQIDMIDILVEVVFVIDVILNFRTTFVNRKGEVVTRPKIIGKHYIRSWFLVDACAALPFDLLCTLNIGKGSRLDLNLLKLIRLLRLARLLQKMDRYSQYSYIILTLLMLIFSLLAHWCACIWYVIASKEIERNPDWKIGWLYQLSDKLNYSVVTTSDMVSSYVTALYFTTSSLTSVGFGNVSANTNAEKIFSIVIMLIGALMHAVVFGNVTALIRVMYARRSNYQTRLRDLKDFFRLHQLPKELQQRMSDYFQTTWSLNHGIETYEILKDFPEELRGDVSLHLHREVLSLPIFETAPQGFLKSLARHIESKFCCPTEYLIHRGDALNYLYLVCNGSMEVLQDNMVVAILGKGDLVGYDVNSLGQLATRAADLAGLAQSTLVKSSSDLKALTYCDLKCIHISGLLEVLKLYPEFSDTFHREIMHDLSFNLREVHEEETEDSQPPTSDEDNHEEDEDDEEDDDDGDEGDDPDAERPAESGARENMGHLYRSITEEPPFKGHQIGRYDHEDPLEEEADGEDEEELECEEEEEEEEEDEEEEIEEEEEDRDEDHDDAASGGAGNANQARPSSPSGSSSSANSANSSNGSGSGARRRRAAGSGSSEKLAANCQPAATSTGRGHRELVARRRLAGASCHDKSQVDDWQSAHSYDGLISTSRRKQSNSSQRLSKIKSDDLVILSESFSGVKNQKSTSSAATPSTRIYPNPAANPLPGQMSSPLKPAMSANNRITSGLSSSNGKKPPLSFDLSRNTTALVDRRRRSAGCIPRQLLRPLNLQVQQRFNAPTTTTTTTGSRVTIRRQTHSSSLTHINEEGRFSRSSSSQLVRLVGRDLAGQQTSGNNCKNTTKRSSNQQPNKQHSLELASSEGHFRNIDERISKISSSVLEMKSELRQELNQFRGTIESLMRLVEVSSGSNSMNLFSNSRLDELQSHQARPFEEAGRVSGGRGARLPPPCESRKSLSRKNRVAEALANSTATRQLPAGRLANRPATPPPSSTSSPLPSSNSSSTASLMQLPRSLSSACLPWGDVGGGAKSAGCRLRAAGSSQEMGGAEVAASRRRPGSSRRRQQPTLRPNNNNQLGQPPAPKPAPAANNGPPQTGSGADIEVVVVGGGGGDGSLASGLAHRLDRVIQPAESNNNNNNNVLQITGGGETTGRALSACSTSPLAIDLLARSNLNSDNDSGRSSTSVLSNSVVAGGNGNSLKLAAATSGLATNNASAGLAGGRVAKVIVARDKEEGEELEKVGSDLRKRYTITD